MTLMSDIQDLVRELDSFQLSTLAEDIKSGRHSGFPDFVTASTGDQVNFTSNSRELLLNIATTIHKNDERLRKAVEVPELVRIVRQCAADFYAEGQLQNISETTIQSIRDSLVECIKLKADQQAQEFTHYFPAWTLGMERVAPYSVGPVTFLTRDQWIDTVDIPDSAKDRYLDARDDNYRWKELLRDSLASKKPGENLRGFAADIYESVNKYPSVLKITLKGLEKTLSRRLAEMICRSALDATSLIFGGREPFHQQALASERLEPIRTNSLIQTNGYLWMPGIALGPRVPNISPARASSALGKFPDVLRAIGYTLNSLADESQHKHPDLASRWSIALDWYAEGNREKNDAIALAKIATSLDVLSRAGMKKGITELLSNLLNIDPDVQVISGREPKTLKQLVGKIYDDGRSQILHGSFANRLENYADIRSKAAHFARLALLESAVRLEKYSGNDDGVAFRTMQRAP